MAKAVGVATSTVSKALRNDPTIPIDRRREIQEAARTLGYQPDPLISTLMARLHGQRRRVDPHHIAWIDLWPDDKQAALAGDFKLMFHGATERAKELGYQLEVYRARRDGTSPARLRQILIARSQWGLIIPPVPTEAMSYPLDLQDLAAVTIGTSLHEPVMHRVATNLFQGCQLACQQLRKKGFRRIGFVLTPTMHERVEGKWLGAYLAEQASWPRAERLTPLLAPTQAAAAFSAWFKRSKPDVIVVAEPHVKGWLAVNPLKSPAPTVWLRLMRSMHHDTPAIDNRPDKIGAAAVELVVGQIHRNERGSPKIPHTLLLDGVWVE